MTPYRFGSIRGAFYLNARMTPSYRKLEATAIYQRGAELCRLRRGPTPPVQRVLDQVRVPRFGLKYRGRHLPCDSRVCAS
jgi:hypothetical protein